VVPRLDLGDALNGEIAHGRGVTSCIRIIALLVKLLVRLVSLNGPGAPESILGINVTLTALQSIQSGCKRHISNVAGIHERLTDRNGRGKFDLLGTLRS